MPSVIPSAFFLQMEELLGNEHPSLGEVCCVCGKSLKAALYYGAGTGSGRRFACAECYAEQTSPALEEEDEGGLAILDEHRIRKATEFEDDMVAYVEGLWGKRTFAFNVAIRDLEAMRRGMDDKALREPRTYHEAALLVKHIRALANDVARHFKVVDVHPDDDLAPRKVET